MRNYIILNDVNSNTINGLLIQELPPISKPKMRTQIEEIDGRAGDIVTQLGYAAYTKTISVGLYGDFDIDEVISYFNSSGTVVFSNEPDKYYNYQILEQIDYERLIRFRTAKVKMHVQPFKYPTEEEPLVAQYQYVTNTGSNMSLDNTANALFKKFDLKGNTSQDGTPTPSSPIPVNVVSGDNNIEVCGKNLFNVNGGLHYYTNASGVTSDYVHSNSTDYIPCVGGTAYNISGTAVTTVDNNFKVAYFDENKGFISRAVAQVGTVGERKGFTSYAPNNAKYVMAQFYDNITDGQFEKASSMTNYEPYVGTSYPIYLGVENMFDISSVNEKKGIDSSGNLGNNNNLSTSDYIYIEPSTSYYLTNTIGSTYGRCCAYYNDSKTFISAETITGGATINISITTPNNAKFMRVACAYGNENILKVTKGSTPQYVSTTPIELCKIGNYQDMIFKNTINSPYYDSNFDVDKWLLHKEIAKIDLGSLTYTNETSYASGQFRATLNSAVYTGGLFCPILIWQEGVVAYNTLQTGKVAITNAQTLPLLRIRDASFSSYDADTIKTALNGIMLYYQMYVPTTTIITDETLISQLDAIKNASSYEGQTNISHDSNDLPFIVDVAALQYGSDKLTVDNEGNIYSRPTIDLEGTGIVNIYLEGNQMFQVDLTDTNEIVIDTDEMEAYDPSTQALMNRQVTGNYDNFKINAGDNTLKFSGDLTKATITGYVRWL